MSRYIDADAIKWEDWGIEQWPPKIETIAFKEQVDAISTADVVPVVHAQWLERNTNPPYYQCPICGWQDVESTPFCANCGAKMDKGSENNE